MRKIFTLLITVFVSGLVCTAQYVNIPDTTFRKFLQKKYPSCFNDLVQLDTTCSAILNETILRIYRYDYPYGTGEYLHNADGVQYFKSLKELDFHEVEIEQIPKLPDSLVKLVCFSGPISALPPLPQTLIFLECSFTQISSLPPLPASLEYLYCRLGPLQSLPDLPASLKTLVCNTNQLTKLPALPSSLKFLDCSNNSMLSYLPLLSPILDTILCSYCNVSSLPSLPDSLSLLECFGNKIYCLPTLPVNQPFKVIYDKEKISCLPNNDANISAYYYDDNGSREKRFPIYPPPPLCNPADNNHCNIYPRIIGFVYTDINNNGIKDADELYRQNVKINLSNGSSTLSGSNGYFEIAANDTGNFTIDAVPPAFFIGVPASVDYNFNSYDTVVFQNFALQPNTVKDSFTIFMTPYQRRAIAGYGFGYTIKYENTGSTIVSPDIIFNFDSTKISSIFGIELPHVINGNSILISPGIIAPGQSGDFILLFEINRTDKLGDTLLFKTTISAGEATAADSNKVTVHTSTEPNAKEATRQLSPEEVASGEYINYNILFQNMGTDTVYSLVIRDTLSTQLEWNTLEITSSSHTCDMKQEKNRITFKFPGIMLPVRNVNETVPSYGFVSFRVKSKSTVQENTSIDNKASIYFDQKAPVVTNIAKTLISNQPYVFTFNGKGDWNQQANWLYGLRPGNSIPAGVMIVIDPVGGDCLMNVPVTISKGASIIIKEGKNLIVNGMLIIK